MRRKISNETWEQIKTASFGGFGLREIARKMGSPLYSNQASRWEKTQFIGVGKKKALSQA
jgi:hypothetical protein